MALTYWNPDNAVDSGNNASINQFYAVDLNIVQNQTGAVSTALVFFRFRDENLTVYAASDGDDKILELVALPCPPYYHDKVPEAIPGNILTDF